MNKLLKNPSNQLGNIVAKVKLLKTLQDKLHAILEPELARHCVVANYRQGCLVLQLDNAAIATRLRYQIPSLLQQLRIDARLHGLVSIDIYVRPQEQQQESPKQELHLSNKNADLLKETAQYINDPELMKALLKLSEND